MTRDPHIQRLTRTQKAGLLPPWIWFWLVFYLLTFTTYYFTKVDLLIIFTGRDGSNNVSYNLVERSLTLAELFPSTVLFIGILAVLLPWGRALWLKKRYDLRTSTTMPWNTPPETIPLMEEIQAFLNDNAPGVSVVYPRGNKFRELAMIYPVGYRKATIVVSSSLLDLWESNRLRAEAILFHELAHHRHGDTLIIGAGSLLTFAAKYWLPVYVIFSFLPFSLSLIIESVTTFQNSSEVYKILPHQITMPPLISEYFTVISYVFINGGLLFCYSASLFVLLLAAIWCAEFNADRFVLDTILAPLSFMQEMIQQTARPSKGRWLIAGMSHPPLRLRLWMARQSAGVARQVFVLLFFPLAFLVYLLLTVGWQAFFVLSYESIVNVLEELSGVIVYSLRSFLPVWISMAALLMLWPFLTRYWEKVFSKVEGSSKDAPYTVYLIGALFVISMCISGFLFPVRLASFSGPPAITTPTAIPITNTLMPSSQLLKQAYRGTMQSAQGNQSVSETIKLSSVKLDQQGNLSGQMEIAAPLTGRGSFKGTVNNDGAIRFQFIPTSAVGYISIQFSGQVRQDGTLVGIYIIPDISQVGSWQARPA